MKFLVTGATGFIGGALARRLAASGHEVRALVRPGRDTSALEHVGVQPVTGDLSDEPALFRGLEGVDGLFNVAGHYAFWARDRSVFYKTNVDGVNTVLNAARRVGIRKVVHTSTVATLKWPGPGQVADETNLAEVNDLHGDYKKSKLLGEQTALSFNSPELEVVVVNPTAPVGPGDWKPTPTGRIIVEFLKRRFPGYINTGVNICDVDDVADAHVAAFNRGRPGERYILGGENHSLLGIYKLLKQATGLRRWPVRIPFALALAFGKCDDVVEGKLLRREPYIPAEGLQVARRPMYVDCLKAVRELNLRQRPAIESVARAVRWFSDHGYAGAELPATADEEVRAAE